MKRVMVTEGAVWILDFCKEQSVCFGVGDVGEADDSKAFLPLSCTLNTQRVTN